MQRARAALVAVSALLLLAAATAALQGKRDEPTLPGSLTVPAPRPGDRAHYEVQAVQFDGRWGPVPFTVTGLDAEWRTTPGVPDAWGARHDAATLAIRADYDFREPAYSSSVHQESSYDPATWRAVEVANHEEFPEAGPAALLVQADPPSVGTGQPAERRVWFETRMRQLWSGPCGFAPGLQDAPLGGTVRLGGRCGRLLLNEGSRDAFRAVAVEEVDGVPAVRFDNVDDPLVQAWYNPGLPFPVRVRDHFVDLFDPAKTGGWVFEWTLAGFSPGSGSFPTSPPLGGAALPTAPLADGLPDEAGLDHPFSLADAVAAARQDPGVAAFLAGHPQAYVGESQPRETVDEQGRRAWRHSLVLTDGRSAIARHVTLEEGPAPPGGPASALPEALRPRPEVTSWDSGLPADVTGLYPLPSQRPATMPRVADAVAAFFEDANETVRSETPLWGMTNACWGNCSAPVSFLRVGVLRSPGEPTLPVVPGVLAPPDALASVLNVRHDGTVLSRAARTETLVAPAILGADASPDGAARTVRPAPPGGIPYAPIALAAGGLAILGFLLGAKAAAGLFSRIEDDRLLEHPGRASVLQAIEAEPGIHFQALSRRTGIAAGALRHHLRKMQEAGLVVVRPLNGYACHFLPADARRPEAQAGAAARSEGAQRVLEAWRGGVHGVRAIAAATGLSPSTVSGHLARLRAAGAIPAGGEAAAAA